MRLTRTGAATMPRKCGHDEDSPTREIEWKVGDNLESPTSSTHGEDLKWTRLRAWLGAVAALALMATLALSLWAEKEGREAVLSNSWPLAVGTLGIVWISGVVHGRRAILLIFLLSYFMLTMLLVGESAVWRVVGYAQFAGVQVWNLVALCRATPLRNSGVSGRWKES
jgi:hypothetical protein